MDNLPVPRGKKALGKWDGPPPDESDLFPKNNALWSRFSRDPSDVPTIAGRRPMSVRKCKLCSIVRNLTEREEDPLTLDQAMWAEHDLVKMIYLDHPRKEVIDHFADKYNYRIRPDSYIKHLERHIAHPELIKLLRYQGIADRGLDIEFFKRMMRLPYMVIDRVMEGLNDGTIQPSVSDAQKALDFLWSFYQNRERMADEQRFVESFKHSLGVVIQDPYERRRVIRETFKEISKREEQDELPA